MTTFRTLEQTLKEIRTTLSGEPVERPGQCPKCGGDGHVLGEDGRVRACDCLRPEIIRRKLRASRIPIAYNHATLQSFETDATNRVVADRVSSWVEGYRPNIGQGLALMGPNGVGKTHLAVAVLRELIYRGHTGTFYNVINLLDSFKSKYAHGVGDASMIEDDLARDILVLDDLGVQRPTGWSAERLHAVINRRYEMGRTLIITTNKLPSELRKVLDNAIVSRLYEMCQWFEIKGKDRRGQMAKFNKERGNPLPARPERRPHGP